MRYIVCRERARVAGRPGSIGQLGGDATVVVIGGWSIIKAPPNRNRIRWRHCTIIDVADPVRDVPPAMMSARPQVARPSAINHRSSSSSSCFRAGLLVRLQATSRSLVSRPAAAAAQSQSSVRSDIHRTSVGSVPGETYQVSNKIAQRSLQHAVFTIYWKRFTLIVTRILK